MSLWQEFKAFAFKGNMIELAVAVVIGTAFGNVVNALVTNIVMPALSYITPEATYEKWTLGKIQTGLFLAALVNFLIVSLAVFLIIKKVLGSIVRRHEPSAPSEPATKECPLCLSVIPYKARKCAHCTADLPEAGMA